MCCPSAGGGVRIVAGVADSLSGVPSTRIGAGGDVLERHDHLARRELWIRERFRDVRTAPLGTPASFSAASRSARRHAASSGDEISRSAGRVVRRDPRWSGSERSSASAGVASTAASRRN